MAERSPIAWTLASALRAHWPEYLLEAAELGLFMLSACVFAFLIFHPEGSSLAAGLPPWAARAAMGAAMGLTAIALIHSPLGQRSGAHMNPAVTATFWRLGRVRGADALFYVLAQSIGAVLGILVARSLLGAKLSHPSVNHVATVPGAPGPLVAWMAEFAIAFTLMSVVLWSSANPRMARATGLLAGGLVCLWIIFESPLSGMSMNPARSFGSALWAGTWEGLWIYFTAPPLAMLVAAAVHTRLPGAHRVLCAKLHHHNPHRCIFRCEFAAAGQIPPHPTVREHR